MPHIIVAALYQFTPLPEFREWGPRLKLLCMQEKIRGTLLLAAEGINGTVAGSRTAIDALKSFLSTRFDSLEYKESQTDDMPFHRMKVRLKKEIVTLGVPDICSSDQRGTYVEPEAWNDLISNSDVLLIDTRNDYEVNIGTFPGSLNPKTLSFSEFPAFVATVDPLKHRKIAMFCTGGIRCEKASSYMLSQGFKEVYHLKGGILKYLETIPPEQSLWNGDCFVFDGRVAISHGLKQGQYASCHGCRLPITQEDTLSPHYERGVSCPHCYHSLTPQKQQTARDRQRQEDLAKARGEQHIGATMANCRQ